MKSKNTCLVSVEKGDKVLYKGGEQLYTVLDMKLCPNGVMDSSLVVILFCQDDKGNKVSATSNNFRIVPGQMYEELYLSVHLSNLKQ